MFFMKEYRLNSLTRSYSIWIFIFIYYFSWPGAGVPEPKLRYTGSGQKFRLHAAPAPQHWYCTQLDIWISDWKGFGLKTLDIGLNLPSEDILGTECVFLSCVRPTTIHPTIVLSAKAAPELWVEAAVVPTSILFRKAYVICDLGLGLAFKFSRKT
jgi:hypothetical protein